MKKSTRNILIGSGIITAGITAVTAFSCNITKKLVKVASTANNPKHPKNRETNCPAPQGSQNSLKRK